MHVHSSGIACFTFWINKNEIRNTNIAQKENI